MSIATKQASHKIRASHHSWRRSSAFKPMFHAVVTVDPLEVENVWERLSIDTRAIEFQEIPFRLHRALVKMLPSSADRMDDVE
ncbi:hypothetical protein [Celeribacter halophilus]|uniref:Uncharacterized protein n=1 Tax=Celeribacter halophilus TaxID=576117 RepID=A0A1I3RK40_9RHOB|nr:hypothetical protein [Celeribacter halophilus]PZX12625.1 hypothetical protein LX82_01368 [Celeribacter halophilus]SFJ46400.1 hypothetical protein SAMN04488138_105130 [Celeribacter halophilus]